jgi:cytochrome oxidase Cu insertion factor (SCO1/SenC/PrrC family)
VTEPGAGRGKTGGPPPATTQRPSSELERAAALAAGPTKVPRKVLVIGVACLVVLGLGGAALDHVFPGPVGAVTATTVAGQYPPPFQVATTAEAGAGAGSPAQLSAPMAAMMGLEKLKAASSPGFSLTDQHGHRVTLAQLRGKVVVISFFDSACDDICPVMGKELLEAYRDLGTDRSRVVFLTVNTDPLATTPGPVAAVRRSGLASLAAWHFLSGPLAQLDAVWRAYGLSIDVQRPTGTISHNDVLYFIDPSSHWRYRATPFADENAAGVFALPSASEASWGEGIGDQVRSLLAVGRQ